MAEQTADDKRWFVRLNIKDIGIEKLNEAVHRLKEQDEQWFQPVIGLLAAVAMIKHRITEARDKERQTDPDFEWNTLTDAEQVKELSTWLLTNGQFGRAPSWLPFVFIAEYLHVIPEQVASAPADDISVAINQIACQAARADVIALLGIDDTSFDSMTDIWIYRVCQVMRAQGQARAAHLRSAAMRYA